MRFRQLRSVFLISSCFTVVDSCSESTAPGHGPAAQFDVVTGDAQAGVVGTELAAPLTVRVVDAGGLTVPGQLVNFRVTAGGGSVFAGSAITNADGIARERFTLGTSTADSQVVQARAIDPATGAALVLQVFHARAVADLPASAVVTSGAGQSVAPSTRAADSLSVVVRDKYGNPVTGLPVEWTTPAASGTLSRQTDTTSVTGVAQTVWTAPAKAGGYVVSGVPRGLSTIAFPETVLPAAPAQMSLEWTGATTLAVTTRLEPAVRVLDAFGNAVPGVRVAFTIVDGSGQLTAASVVTDADGRATAGWTLGAIAGTNTLRADAAGVTAVSLSITGSSGAASVLTKTAGDNQTAAPGTVLPVVPAVRVTDANGNGIAGVPVTFTVTVGAGSVQAGTTATNSAGNASPASWTLGASRGTNTLQVSTSFATVAFTATSQLKSPDITVQINTPALSASPSGDSLKVAATVTSVRQLTAVSATVGSTVVPMNFALNAWSATVPISALARGEQLLIVTATDASGATTEALRTFIHDRAPQISVITPVAGEVAQASVGVSATCADDDPGGCTSLTVTLGPSLDNILLSGSSSVSGSVSVAGLAPNVEVHFNATDSRGQVVTVKRYVQVEPNSHLVALTAAPTGKVWDYLNGRMLVGADNNTTPNPQQSPPFEIISASGSRESIAFDTALVAVDRAYLGPRGAIFSKGQKLLDYRDGVVSTLNDLSSATIEADSNFAIFVRGTAYGMLYRRNLTTGMDVLVDSSAGNTENSVTATGAVAFWGGGGIQLYRNGALTRITPLGDATSSVYPVTDGNKVVFARSTGTTYQTVLWSDSTLTVLVTDLPYRPQPNNSYRVRNGWVAFAKPDISGATQIWTRALDGTLRQVSAVGPGTSLVIDGVGDDGSVAFSGLFTHDHYVATPTGAAFAITSNSTAKILWRDGGFVALIGRMVFKVVP